MLYGVSYRVFDHLLFGLTEAPELGQPIVIRLIEMAHLLFFVMLFVSSLSVSLSVLYIDPEVAYLGTTPISHPMLMIERTFITIIRSAWFVVFAGAAILFAHSFAAHRDSLVSSFVYSMIIHVIFLISPVCLGMVGTMLIVRFIPARRAKTALLLLSIISLTTIVLAMRWMMPERFLRPTIDPNLGLLLKAIAEPAAPWLPSGWVASGVVSGQTGALFKVIAFSSACFVFTQIVASTQHLKGFGRFLSERSEVIKRRGFDFVQAITSALPKDLALVSRKDLKIFWRDPTQWSQLIVLLALVVIYSFNFSQFRGQIERAFLRDIISFVNLIMAGFVLVAVANRFVFSAISLEGPAFWLLRSSPFSLRRVLISKASFSFLPLLILAEIITFSANRVLEVSFGFTIASILIVFLMTMSLTSLAVSLGALSPRFDLKDPAQIGMTQSGILFMGLGMGYVLTFIAIIATQVVIALRWRFLFERADMLHVIVPIALCLILNAAAIIIPWNMAIKKIEQMEIYA